MSQLDSHGDPLRQAGHRHLSRYDFGLTAASACQYDQRFSYCMYVPKRFDRVNPASFRLLVAVHGTNRPNQQLLRRFSDFADKQDFVVLAPLFPARIAEADDLDNYKYILYQNIRFDLVLINMVQEASERYGADWSRFSLFGFSGGAHFSHRFLYLHADRLDAVSIAAPGSVTLIDSTREWWVGISNCQKLFGKAVDVDEIKRVPIHLVVGADDSDTSEIIHSPGSSHWMDGANDAGKNRIERLKTLAGHLERREIQPELEILAGVAHMEGPLVDAAIGFFERTLCAK